VGTRAAAHALTMTALPRTRSSAAWLPDHADSIPRRSRPPTRLGRPILCDSCGCGRAGPRAGSWSSRSAFRLCPAFSFPYVLAGAGAGRPDPFRFGTGHDDPVRPAAAAKFTPLQTAGLLLAIAGSSPSPARRHGTALGRRGLMTTAGIAWERYSLMGRPVRTRSDTAGNFSGVGVRCALECVALDLLRGTPRGAL